LSSSGGSSKIAAQFGMGLVIARFINGQAGPAVVDTYRKQFTPSVQFPLPQAMLAISVLCAPTDEQAQQMRKLMDYRLLQFEKGNFDKPGGYETVKDYIFSTEELERIKYNSGRIVSGTPLQVKEQLLQLANDFDIDEIIVATMAGTAAERKRSFELLAEVFELNAVTTS
jgi:alkanesulfonate monooxygenase SsuD/methylene tetrahydromethanopterin reductase-like flavin-dependent oxidoreductase (luciferase family)